MTMVLSISKLERTDFASDAIKSLEKAKNKLIQEVQITNNDNAYNALTRVQEALFWIGKDEE